MFSCAQSFYGTERERTLTTRAIAKRIIIKRWGETEEEEQEEEQEEEEEQEQEQEQEEEQEEQQQQQQQQQKQRQKPSNLCLFRCVQSLHGTIRTKTVTRTATAKQVVFTKTCEITPQNEKYKVVLAGKIYIYKLMVKKRKVKKCVWGGGGCGRSREVGGGG